MKIDVLEQKENPFLKRQDLMLSIDHSGLPTPKKIELEKGIAEHFKAQEDKVEIIYIFSDPGIAKSKVKARIWKEKVIKKEKPKEEGEVSEAQTNENVGTGEG